MTAVVCVASDAVCGASNAAVSGIRVTSATRSVTSQRNKLLIITNMLTTVINDEYLAYSPRQRNAHPNVCFASCIALPAPDVAYGLYSKQIIPKFHTEWSRSRYIATSRGFLATARLSFQTRHDYITHYYSASAVCSYADSDIKNPSVCPSVCLSVSQTVTSSQRCWINCSLTVPCFLLTKRCSVGFGEQNLVIFGR